MLLMDQNQERLKLMLEELSNIPNHNDANVKKLADFNNSFMDEKTIEELGIEPILDLLNISKNSLSDPVASIAEIHSKYSCKPLFSLHASPDKKDSEFSLCNLYQGGLGLPDRDCK
jgi:putative endopeptidase